ncbi:Glycosaminoglycan xylosylkinase [Halotydeus destructor]|nr:Glycosaminoglycan xylosylkinase [Halotydeus destructor]
MRRTWSTKFMLIVGLLCCNLLIAGITVLSFSYIQDDQEMIHKSTKIVHSSRLNYSSKARLALAENYMRLIRLRVSEKLKQDAFAKLLSRELSTRETIKLANLEHHLTEGSNFIANMKYVPSVQRAKQIWLRANSWATMNQLILPDADIGSVVNALARSRIVKADLSKRGTQLKLLITLESGQKAYFKPKRYSLSDVINGSSYAGFDRHNGEIVSFHLARLLDFRTAPLVAGRKVDLTKELLPVAASRLKKTFTHNNCFYGDCFFCKSSNLVCPDADGQLEGSVIFLLDDNLKLYKHRHPWQRTYKDGAVADWEIEDDYCRSIEKKLSVEPRLLDLIDVAIFDFLIGNADRHHYELLTNSPNASVLLLDNGKSFGNPEADDLSILAPLYQCCLIRRRTYLKLMLLRHDMRRVLKSLISFDSLAPLLSESHLVAVDRRLKTILATIYVCMDEKSIKEVLL